MNVHNYSLGVLILALTACGGQSNIDQIKQQTIQSKAEPLTLAEAEKDWATNHGVGTVTAFELPLETDTALVSSGKEIFVGKCSACHKVDKRFVGPALKGVTSRRTPAWIMNMILNPEKMVAEDPIAKKLLVEYNGSPMANQSLTQEEARAVLEYFKTL